MRRRDLLLCATILALALLIAGGLSRFASDAPDGLEHVAETLGFAEAETDPSAPEVMPDYELPLLGAGPNSGAAAGLLGVLGVLALLGLLGLLFRLCRGSRTRQATVESPQPPEPPASQPACPEA